MIDDTGDPYGARRPGRLVAMLIACARRMPHNALGKELAHALRSLVTAFAPLPLDLETDGIRMRCWFRDNHSEKKFVFTPWRFDPHEREFIKRVLPREGTFVDIGANVGIYTLTAAQRLGGSGRVLAIEPNPAMYRRLEFNVVAMRNDADDWPSIELALVGISDVAGHIELHLDESNLGGSSIVAHAAGGRTIEIECRELETVLREHGIAQIDVLKIDIEGAEDRALVPFLERAPAMQLPRHITHGAL
ncbi:MAG: FkbM family methyltransferase [Halofilum sp. (in: g-proteobacteria)]|nr:FkbM family methyltransferase [Halofilum sp. (in: g-proteobacteria)]